MVHDRRPAAGEGHERLTSSFPGLRRPSSTATRTPRRSARCGRRLDPQPRQPDGTPPVAGALVARVDVAGGRIEPRLAVSLDTNRTFALSCEHMFARVIILSWSPPHSRGSMLRAAVRGRGPRSASYVVRPTDTLWSIASRAVRRRPARRGLADSRSGTGLEGTLLAARPAARPALLRGLRAEDGETLRVDALAAEESRAPGPRGRR